MTACCAKIPISHEDHDCSTGTEKLLACLPEQMSKMDPVDQRIAIHIYRQLAMGQPVDSRDVTQEFTETGDEVSAAWARLSPEIKTNEIGNIVAFAGLSLASTTHKLSFEGKTLYAWCAWDTLFIPHILDRSVRVLSIDPVSKRSIQVDVQRDQSVSVVPSETVVTFPKPAGIDPRLLETDTVAAFCSFVHFFENAQSAGSWIEHHGLDNVLILSLENAYELGIRRNQLRFPLALQPGTGSSIGSIT